MELDYNIEPCLLLPPEVRTVMLQKLMWIVQDYQELSEGYFLQRQAIVLRTCRIDFY